MDKSNLPENINCFFECCVSVDESSSSSDDEKN